MADPTLPCLVCGVETPVPEFAIEIGCTETVCNTCCPPGSGAPEPLPREERFLPPHDNFDDVE